MNSHAFSVEYIGEPLAYPGHPVAIAYLIMRAYDDLTSAQAPTEDGWEEALSCSRLQGSGSAVANGLEVLRQIAAGAGAAEIVDRVGDYWAGDNASDETRSEGRRQGMLAASLIMERLDWFGDRPLAAATRGI